MAQSLDADPRRLTRLIEVGQSLLSELRLEVVLDLILDTACELTGARYAALGVIDPERGDLARFVTRGIDPATRETIGELPRGRGVLGVLIDDPRPLRLHDVSAHPQSYGFPAGHPPMSTFLGVPIVVRGQVWGNLYLTERSGGVDFDDADEASAIVLAHWAAIAIENARLYEALDRRRDELERSVRGFEATAVIAQAVGAETDLSRVLELVVKRGRALMNARAVLVLLVEGDDLVLAAAAGQASAPGGRLAISGSLCGEVLRSGSTVRVDDIESERRFDGRPLGVFDAAAALFVPLTYKRRGLGVLCAFDRLEEPAVFDHEDEQLLQAFAASAATAVATAKSVEHDRVRAAMSAAEAERRRWARELHDETLQGLGALKVALSTASRSPDATRLRQAVDVAVDGLSSEIDSLRTIITELRPASLDALGLVPALQTLLSRAASSSGLEIESHIELDGELRLDAELETAIYRVSQEALTNVSKHAAAGRVVFAVRRDDASVVLTVTDDGVGFDPAAQTSGFGLAGMRERVALTGGSLEITTTAGTRLQASFPLVRDQPGSSP